MSDVKVKFGAEDENLTSTLNKVQKELKQVEQKADSASTSVGSGFGKMAGMAAIAGAGVAAGMKVIELATDAARAVVNNFGNALDMGGRLSDLSGRTGETAGKLLLLERAFDNTGVGADKVGSSINKLQKFIYEAGDASGTQAGVMRALGISLDDLKDKTPTDQMRIFAERITAIQDPGERAAAAMTIFGKSGGELLPMLTNFSGEVDTASGQLGSMVGVMDRSSAVFDAVSDNLTVIKGKALEVAAGFLEKASPALEKFTNMLTGVDAAAWGQKMMDMVMRVSDTLMGAFRSPLTAIDAIGSALYSMVATSGNALINSYITGFTFVKKFWTSELPALLVNQLGSALMLAFTKGLKFFTDNILNVANGFKELFAGAISKVVTFMADSFDKVVKFFAEDFVNAITSPIDFISGKFKSGLGDAGKSGAFAFVDSYQSANGTVLEKLSTGLGAAATVYSANMAEGTSKIHDEFGRIISEITPAATDFFGAKPAAEKLAEDFKKMQESGKKMRESWAGVNAEAQQTNGAVANIAFNTERTAVATRQTKEDMKEIRTVGDIISAREDADSKKSYSQRWKQAKKDAKDYEDYLGGDFSKRSIRDMASAMKIDVAGKESGELLDEIENRMAKFKGIEIKGRIDKDATKEQIDQLNDFVASQFKELELKLGTEEALKQLQGIEKKVFELDLDGTESVEDIKKKLQEPVKMDLQSKDGKDGNATLEAIKTAVEVIRTLVAKIEPKLPQTALSN